MIVTTSDFQGKYSLSQGMYNTPDYQYYIDKYEPKYLKELLNVSSHRDLRNYKELFIDYNTPSLRALKKCVISKLRPDKHYLAKDRCLIVVFYGKYNNKVYENLKVLLRDTNIPYKENVRFIDIVDFASLFKFNYGDGFTI